MPNMVMQVSLVSDSDVNNENEKVVSLKVNGYFGFSANPWQDPSFFIA